mgnify:CR=1 FL=1
MANVLEGYVTGKGLKFGIVVARFNEFITSKLLSGALDTLHRHETDDANIDVAWVPGAFEIPLVAKKLAASGKYDAVISNVGVTEQRKEKFDFSTYRLGLHGFFVKADSKVTSIKEPKDASGKTIGVELGGFDERIFLYYEDDDITARIIKVVNSPLLRTSKEITDIQMAISRLGINYTCNLATGLAMEQMFQATSDVVDRKMREVWNKSTEIAGICHVLCRHYTRLMPDQATLAGLVHQIGVLPILTYAEENNALLASQPDCVRYDPSVEGRFELYKRSMAELLHPTSRGRKITLTNADLLIDMGIRPLEGKVEKPLHGFGQVKIPMGTSAGYLNGLQHKQLVGDLFLAKRDPARLEAAGKKALVPTLQAIADEVLKNPSRFVDVLRQHHDFIAANYQSCDQLVENEGHRFGEDLSEADKKAVTAFLATL